ncbi:hypothetical protein A3A21_00195 [Candidatus Jorgensenbacteria bacterium RIFCSPLOWO2_01_FULL_45_25b]|uniref:ABC transporter domain-containing protein n=1 Tax=Candidatus Jorgensenbacteria bacterium RIFCSPLOWO2_01_FULL_45_25b TaxID=1798471 RepID=A0A1F6BS95_9BACT|nr:MAG: hypothetical protein A3A21_00195 [Candidatus Jorgensenbacteria bacterium RIFCSPLOWO2_01_FULL_45_25b]
MYNHGDVILRFNGVSFSFGPAKPILDEASFSVRGGAKITLMGQNGAGKSSILQLITKNLEPEEGKVTVSGNITVAIAKQTIPRNELELTVREFFESAFKEKIYDIDPKSEKILQVVNLHAVSLEKKIKQFSGGQQARLLLAFALIQNPDLLLLDEPTNNLDKEGIEHLKKFLIDFKNTCIVISHDADFLNSFSHGVLYLDIHTRKVEQYVGNYYVVVEEIAKRIERERMLNVRLEKDIENRKEQANFFAQKGGRLRNVAKKMREKIDELEENKVDIREEDKKIRNFFIPCEENLQGEIVNIQSVSVVKNHKTTAKKVAISLKKNQHLLLSGPNGIGKTTLLESIAKGTAKGISFQEGVRVGYYRQDFSTLDFNESAYSSLTNVVQNCTEENLRSVAAGFLLNAEILKTKIGSLSEGQKGLLSLARLVLQKPGLLILDEPTNHINFRHIPVIAEALNKYEGAMILVSHVADFVQKIRIDETLDLAKL